MFFGQKIGKVFRPVHMEPHGQGPWYLHEIPACAKASEGYPLVAKSAGASSFWHKNDSATLMHSFTRRARGFLRRRIKWRTIRPYPVLLRAPPVSFPKNVTLFGIAGTHDFHPGIPFYFKRLSKNHAWHDRQNYNIMIL
jgi:hypothetical protein